RLSRRPEVTRFEYGSGAQVRRVVLPGGTVWRYGYDPFGRRVGKCRYSADGQVLGREVFGWDGDELVAQLSIDPGDGAVTTHPTATATATAGTATTSAVSAAGATAGATPPAAAAAGGAGAGAGTGGAGGAGGGVPVGPLPAVGPVVVAGGRVSAVRVWVYHPGTGTPIEQHHRTSTSTSTSTSPGTGTGSGQGAVTDITA